MTLSTRIAGLAEAPTLRMAAQCRAMQAQGIDVISMALGEPDMDTPEPIRRAAQAAIDHHMSHYGPVPGLGSLRAAIVAHQNSREGNRITYAAEDVIVSVGAKQAICNTIETLIGPDDEVIIPTPSWVSYGEMVRLAEGMVVNVPTRREDDYCLTPEQLRDAITSRTKLVLLCSPNNPTGSIYSKTNLDELVAVLREYPQIAVLSDEIYSALTYGQPAVTLAAYPEMADRLIIVNGISKAYAMTGYRIGWLLTKDKAFVAACTRLQSQQITCASVPAQAAAEAALTLPMDESIVATFAKRRELIIRLAQEIPGFRFSAPQGAFYLFPDVTTYGTADEVTEYLLREAHVAVVSGTAFGCPDCIRLSYAIAEEQIIEAMRRIKVAIEKYNFC